ncbi:hypothetical protein GN958_ATG10443 [Phytophthora infestans]|uniref:Uncharacterized protein n=1 Tax=Phytophthora infestans TaxID=4787 RepID=A0A8S9ULK8_PHYIN|nr:hypothetical protein GN958_ATG10443 [Phytophthora infestans]
MYTRRVLTSKNADTYVQDMERRRRLLLNNGGSMEDWEIVDLLLIRSLLVLPLLAMEHTRTPPPSESRVTSSSGSKEVPSTGDGSRGLPACQVHGVAARDQGTGNANKKRKSSNLQQPENLSNSRIGVADCKVKGYWCGNPECLVPMPPKQAVTRAKCEKAEQMRAAEKTFRSFAGAALVNYCEVDVADDGKDKNKTVIQSAKLYDPIFSRGVLSEKKASTNSSASVVMARAASVRSFKKRLVRTGS